VQKGDRVVIWKTLGRSDKRGVVALGEVLANPTVSDASNEVYWVNPAEAGIPELRVTFRYVRPPRLPLWLSDDSPAVLRELTVSHGQGTVFKVTPDQWDALLQAVGGWPAAAAEVQEARDHIAEATGKGGQGYRMKPEIRRAIELHAMERATAYYVARGCTWMMCPPGSRLICYVPRGRMWNAA